MEYKQIFVFSSILSISLIRHCLCLQDEVLEPRISLFMQASFHSQPPNFFVFDTLIVVFPCSKTDAEKGKLLCVDTLVLTYPRPP